MTADGDNIRLDDPPLLQRPEFISDFDLRRLLHTPNAINYLFRWYAETKQWNVFDHHYLVVRLGRNYFDLGGRVLLQSAAGRCMHLSHAGAPPDHPAASGGFSRSLHDASSA